jgi:hypothetical protein
MNFQKRTLPGRNDISQRDWRLLQARFTDAVKLPEKLFADKNSNQFFMLQPVLLQNISEAPPGAGWKSGFILIKPVAPYLDLFVLL